MDIYQLDYILHEPQESHGWMYRAEIPDLQGLGRQPGGNPGGSQGSGQEHDPAPQGKRGTPAAGDICPEPPQRQLDRGRVTYRQLRAGSWTPGLPIRAPGRRNRL